MWQGPYGENCSKKHIVASLNQSLDRLGLDYVDIFYSHKFDANTPLEEYEVQWTIRHEFGHILRLPDYYVEFYDTHEDIAINYQLDTTDLMCSRAGDFNERIYTELKRVYFR